MYFLGGLLLFSERMSLSIKGVNERQDSLINMFMLSVPITFVYKLSSMIFIFTNLAKFEAVREIQEYFEHDILYETFHHVAITTGVVFSKDPSITMALITLLPEIMIAIFIISLNYV
jgi:hypothetical protein